MSKVFPASITPLNSDGTLDKRGLTKVIRRNIRHRINGVFLLGAMSEWMNFDLDLKMQLLHDGLEAPDSRITIFAGITDVSLPLPLRNLKAFSEPKPDACVFMSPRGHQDPVRA